MARSWRDSVLDAITRLAERCGTNEVDRQSLISEELSRVVAETESRGATPEQTLSRVLQDLRDEGLLEFLGDGSYRLLSRPVYAELVDLSDDQIDNAIRRRLLRLGQVETATEVGATRQRRGQARVRDLTLENYHGECALCDVKDASLLVAGHILPWADAPDARGDLSNVVCLCRFHDVLFEQGYWSLTDDLSVLIRTPAASATVRALLPETVTFKRPAAYLPNPDHLHSHRERHGF